MLHNCWENSCSDRLSCFWGFGQTISGWSECTPGNLLYHRYNCKWKVVRKEISKRRMWPKTMGSLTIWRSNTKKRLDLELHAVELLPENGFLWNASSNQVMDASGRFGLGWIVTYRWSSLDRGTCGPNPKVPWMVYRNASHFHSLCWKQPRYYTVMP